MEEEGRRGRKIQTLKQGLRGEALLGLKTEEEDHEPKNVVASRN